MGNPVSVVTDTAKGAVSAREAKRDARDASTESTKRDASGLASARTRKASQKKAGRSSFTIGGPTSGSSPRQTQSGLTIGGI